MYRLLLATCVPIHWVSTRPVVLHHNRIPPTGGFLLASNHTSFYDVSCLIYASTPRFLDFITTTQVMARPILGFIGRNLNTIPLDRGRVNGDAVRKVVARLKEGRPVCLFPEARLAPEEESVIHGGPHRAGLGRMAALANVPVVPCVVLDSDRCGRPTAWLPIRRTRFAVAYGEPIVPPPSETKQERQEAQRWVEEQWRKAVQALAVELEAAMPWRPQRPAEQSSVSNSGHTASE